MRIKAFIDASFRWVKAVVGKAAANKRLSRQAKSRVMGVDESLRNSLMLPSG
jgi:hypothetical protein